MSGRRFWDYSVLVFSVGLLAVAANSFINNVNRHANVTKHASEKPEVILEAVSPITELVIDLDEIFAPDTAEIVNYGILHDINVYEFVEFKFYSNELTESRVNALCRFFNCESDFDGARSGRTPKLYTIIRLPEDLIGNRVIMRTSPNELADPLNEDLLSTEAP